MALIAVCIIVGLIGNMWLVVKIARVSLPYAIASFVFFPVALFFMFAHWGDEDHDVKVPFFLTLIVSLVFVYQLDRIAEEQGLYEDEEVSLYPVPVQPAPPLRIDAAPANA